MRKFTIVSNRYRDEDHVTARRVATALRTNFHAEALAILDVTDKELDIPEGTECLIVLGGDGSMLSVAKRTMDLNLPLVGMNMGHVGYLAELNVQNLDMALERLVNDNYKIEERMMLAGICSIGGIVSGEGIALNDIALTRSGDSQMVGYRIYVNGQFLTDYFADGIIICTPTGSTAYNLSAGGPVVEPSARLMVMTPVCPHNINNRSIVLAPEDNIRIVIQPSRSTKPVTTSLCYDGEPGGNLSSMDTLVISASRLVTRVVRLNSDGFLQILHKKME